MFRQKGMLLMILMVVLSACQSRVLFENAITLPTEGWQQDQFVQFSFPVEDTIGQYEISLIVRNDARYDFSNLFLFISTTAPSGQGIRDTVEIRMADPGGRWYGKGIGGKYTLEVPFKTLVKFPQQGNYKMEIQQGMREEELKYVTDIGLRITKMK